MQYLPALRCSNEADGQGGDVCVYVPGGLRLTVCSGNISVWHERASGHDGANIASDISAMAVQDMSVWNKKEQGIR